MLLPARNEESNIGGVLDRIAQLYPQLPVLVVNDGSTDATPSIVRSRQNVTLLNLPVWLGYGGALQAGYKYALRHGYDAVIQMDSDGQHDPAYIEVLLTKLEAADVVVGSRFLSGQPYRMSAIRRLGCYLLSFAGRLAGIKISDPTSGFQGLRRNALMVAVEDHYPVDYPDIDVLMLMAHSRLRVIEVPVQMYPIEDRKGMHAGFQVLYYGLKMFLSILVMKLRKA